MRHGNNGSPVTVTVTVTVITLITGLSCNPLAQTLNEITCLWSHSTQSFNCYGDELVHIC